jgi:myo-inositol-1(or 4)-monophosphatase
VEERLPDIAVHAVREAGAMQKAWLDRDKKIQFKGVVNLVTEVDTRCETRIIEIIRDAFPDHGILSEETPPTDSASPYRWIIDPLDGTTNYAHGYPCFATSIAVQRRGEVILGVVYDPMLDELFVARRGEGATLNGEPLAVSTTGDLSNALLATGFPYDLRETPDNNVDHFTRMIMEARAVRRDGAAALDLCYVAAGRFDGFWELKLYPWDMAAGNLMIEEAGGLVTNFRGDGIGVEAREVLASNGHIHAQMIEVLQRS